MQKEDIKGAIAKLKETSPKRNFKQSYDLIINFRGLDLKKPEHKIDFFCTLQHGIGKKQKIAALIGPELQDTAKENCDLTVLSDSFSKYADKKAMKTLADGYDWFIAQATIMPQIAKIFGRVFGPKGKMPNPKAGCVVPPNANLKLLCERLQNTLRLQIKNDPAIRCKAGTEDMPEEQVIDNIQLIHDSIVGHLPGGNQNVRNVILKLTMSPPIKIAAKKDASKVEVKTKKGKKPSEKKQKIEASAEETAEAPAKKQEKPKTAEKAPAEKGEAKKEKEQQKKKETKKAPKK